MTQKISITIEDVAGEGVIVIGDPSMEALMAKMQARGQLSNGELLAVAAWMAIADQARKISEAHTHGDRVKASP